MRFAQAMPAALQDGCARTCLAAAIMVKRAAATSIGLCGMGSWGQAAAAVWAVVAGHCCSLEPLLQLGCCCCMIVESGCNPVSSMLLWVDGAVPDEGANHIRGRQLSLRKIGHSCYQPTTWHATADGLFGIHRWRWWPCSHLDTSIDAAAAAYNLQLHMQSQMRC